MSQNDSSRFNSQHMSCVHFLCAFFDQHYYCLFRSRDILVSSHFMTVQIRRKSHLVIEVWLNNKVTVIIQVFFALERYGGQQDFFKYFKPRKTICAFNSCFMQVFSQNELLEKQSCTFVLCSSVGLTFLPEENSSVRLLQSHLPLMESAIIPGQQQQWCSAVLHFLHPIPNLNLERLIQQDQLLWSHVLFLLRQQATQRNAAAANR